MALVDFLQENLSFCLYSAFAVPRKAPYGSVRSLLTQDIRYLWILNWDLFPKVTQPCGTRRLQCWDLIISLCSKRPLRLILGEPGVLDNFSLSLCFSFQ